MKKHLSVLSLLLALGILFGGCYDKPKGQFTLKGRLLQKADSTPVAGHQITVMYKLYKGGLSGEKKFVETGSTKSDSDGYFEVLCDYYGEPTYYFKENDFANAFIYPKMEGDIVDLDTLFVLP